MSDVRQILPVLAIASFSLGAYAPSSPVADAAMRRDVAAVRSLIAKGTDVNAPQGDGMTALHWAARYGDVEIATLLLRAKASLTSTTRIGAYTPLHVASEAGSAPVVAALLKAGADAKATTSTGVTALHFAALSGSAESISDLVKRGADPNATEPEWGQTPLMLAAARGRTGAVKALLANGADPAITARVLDLMARAVDDQKAKARRNQVLRAGRKAQGADSLGTWHPDTKLVQDAVRASKDVEKNPSAVVAAEEAEPYQGTQTGGDEDLAGFTAMVGFQGGLTALHLAVREGQTEVVQALLDANAAINQLTPADKTSPLLLATINGHYDLAKMLLERGADPNVASGAGATPLYAVINKEWAPTSRTPQPAYHLQQQTTYLELMEALLKAKADPNARLKRSLWYTTYNRDNLRVDFTGATPFWRAAYATDLAAMKMLLAYGADPKVSTLRPPPRQRRGGGNVGGADVPDPSQLAPIPEGGPGIYAIHAASGTGYGQGYAANDHRHAPDAWLATVKFLVEELGVDVNARDFNGYTALHNAAARGDNEMIKYLVSKGADVKAVARTGQTTADMANGPVQRISPFLDTVALLESLGSKNNHRCVSC
ncbi:MAG: ankyrin repeat domain-containing protein [Gemmatimonadaceae bacterium]